MIPFGIIFPHDVIDIGRTPAFSLNVWFRDYIARLFKSFPVFYWLIFCRFFVWPFLRFSRIIFDFASGFFSHFLIFEWFQSLSPRNKVCCSNKTDCYNDKALIVEWLIALLRWRNRTTEKFTPCLSFESNFSDVSRFLLLKLLNGFLSMVESCKTFFNDTLVVWSPAGRIFVTLRCQFSVWFCEDKFLCSNFSVC